LKTLTAELPNGFVLIRLHDTAPVEYCAPGSPLSGLPDTLASSAKLLNVRPLSLPPDGAVSLRPPWRAGHAFSIVQRRFAAIGKIHVSYRLQRRLPPTFSGLNLGQPRSGRPSVPVWASSDAPGGVESAAGGR
jgi:hypothetical protein